MPWMLQYPEIIRYYFIRVAFRGEGTMNYFLPAAQLREEIMEILEEARYLREIISLDGRSREALVAFYRSNGYDISYEGEVARAVQAILCHAETLAQLFRNLSCEPLIWLGSGSTEEVIAMLTQLLNQREAAPKDQDAKRGTIHADFRVQVQ
ncbi:MAG: hypothetical protein ACPLPR_04735 [Bacillota bacterium]